jgi:hypothetical protein
VGIVFFLNPFSFKIIPRAFFFLLVKLINIKIYGGRRYQIFTGAEFFSSGISKGRKIGKKRFFVPEIDQNTQQKFLGSFKNSGPKETTEKNPQFRNDTKDFAFLCTMKRMIWNHLNPIPF